MEFLRVTGENLDREHICCAPVPGLRQGPADRL